jgi:cytochrome P450/NADPH-cytochrome P450 reductase
MTVPEIPQPRPLPLVGNAPDIETRTPVQSMMQLARELGPIFRLTFPSQKLIVVSGHALAADACDETRFEKHVHGPLKNIRELAGDGLFTAQNDEPNWGKAHRLLMPAFGPMAMRSYFDDMLDIADQLFAKWERLGPDTAFDVADNMTRLTLDTIALCAFGYRFNSFYQESMHPFVEAMVRSLAEAGARSRRIPLQTKLMFITQRQFDADNRYMHAITDELIAKRRALKDSPKDLLGLMLSAIDPVTGETLDDTNIRNQLVTFLIAGHETTSGLLSFATHLLLEHPDVLARARGDIDRVLGTDLPRFEDLAQLGYLDQILRETLRLYPTAPAFAVHAKAPTKLGGLYPIDVDDPVLVLTPSLHRDPEVWPDPERFDPDRFAPEARDRIPAHAWVPFGTGVRSCIGRAFAMQEATLVLAMMLQRFDISRPGPYALEIKETLTLKPDGLTVKAKARRPGLRFASRTAEEVAAPVAVAGHQTPLLLLYGSNSGASEAFARRLAADGGARGYAIRVAPLDAATAALPKAGATVIITASYNGQPPDNARAFCTWLPAATDLAGVRYAVFGCGNRDWGTTYQAVPTFVDDRLAAAGAERLIARGEADARGDFFGDFERWYAPFWDTLGAALGVTASVVTAQPLYQVELVAPAGRELVQQHALELATIVENRELVAPGGRSKRHLELALPAGQTYTPGDYLAVLPENHAALVDRVLRRFALDGDAAVVLHSTRGEMAASLPTGRPVSVRALLGRHVELSAPATRKDLERLAASNPCPPHRDALLALAERHQRDVLEKRVSVLDLLEQYPSCMLTFAELLELLPIMRVRQYSISSSPRRTPGHCTLTIAVVDAPAWSGIGTFRGTASSYLAQRAVGDQLAVAVRSPHNPFHPPEASVPMILICAGTGLAPFRGFLEDRALRGGGAETLLFFGCDHADVDFLYRDELAAWERAGVVTVLPAFSLQPVDDVAFVQHRVWQERARVAELIDRGATIFVCGDGQRMAPAVRSAIERIYRDRKKCSDAEARAWLDTLEREGRYVADVFA